VLRIVQRRVLLQRDERRQVGRLLGVHLLAVGPGDVLDELDSLIGNLGARDQGHRPAAGPRGGLVAGLRDGDVGELVALATAVLGGIGDLPVTADGHAQLLGPEGESLGWGIRREVGAHPAGDLLRIVCLLPVVHELEAGDDAGIGRGDLAAREVGELAAVIEAPGVVPALVEGTRVAAGAGAARHPAHDVVVAAGVLLVHGVSDLGHRGDGGSALRDVELGGILAGGLDHVLVVPKGPGVGVEGQRVRLALVLGLGPGERDVLVGQGRGGCRQLGQDAFGGALRDGKPVGFVDVRRDPTADGGDELGDVGLAARHDRHLHADVRIGRIEGVDDVGQAIGVWRRVARPELDDGRTRCAAGTGHRRRLRAPARSGRRGTGSAAGGRSRRRAWARRRAGARPEHEGDRRSQRQPPESSRTRTHGSSYSIAANRRRKRSSEPT
jgi:hypothetical protein